MSVLAKEKQQKLQDKFQAILGAMLREEENKYCADCDAKGPRWASWNLGVFICIRCAGIHRNLGVHISRVKSVNLDQWTAEQIAVNILFFSFFYFDYSLLFTTVELLLMLQQYVVNANDGQQKGPRNLRVPSEREFPTLAKRIISFFHFINDFLLQIDMI